MLLVETAVSVVLGISEHVWCCNGTVLHANALLQRGNQWQTAFACCRNVDVTCMISTTLCRTCIVHMLDELGPVLFDAEQECNPAPWLDLPVSTTRNNVLIMPMFKPLTTAPAWSCDRHEPISVLQGMISRLCQVEARAYCIIRDVLNGMENLTRGGWTQRFLRNRFHSFGPQHTPQPKCATCFCVAPHGQIAVVEGTHGNAHRAILTC